MKENFEFLKRYLGGKRQSELTEEDVYMLLAVVNSGRSKDPSTQTGACYVNENNEVIAIGHNHPPKGWDEDSFPWGNNVKDDGEENTKYPYIIHAETDAIINHKGNKEDFMNSTLYTSLFPCANCAKHIVEAGIRRIVFLNVRKGDRDYLEARRLLDACGIELVDYKETMNIKSVELDLTQNEKNNIKILKKL